MQKLSMRNNQNLHIPLAPLQPLPPQLPQPLQNPMTPLPLLTTPPPPALHKPPIPLSIPLPALLHPPKIHLHPHPLMFPLQLRHRRPRTIRHGPVFAQIRIDRDGDAGAGGEGQQRRLQRASQGRAQDVLRMEVRELRAEPQTLRFAVWSQERIGEVSGAAHAQVVVALVGVVRSGLKGD